MDTDAVTNCSLSEKVWKEQGGKRMAGGRDAYCRREGNLHDHLTEFASELEAQN